MEIESFLDTLADLVMKKTANKLRSQEACFRTAP
jgi:hypothetical protein